MISRRQRQQSAHNVPKHEIDPPPEKVVEEAPVFVEPPPVVESPAPEPVADGTIEVIGIRPAPNKNFIYASLNGERVAVFTGKRWAVRLAGKKFKVTAEKDGDQTIYRYEP